jgi:hypothetical protein
MVAPKRYVDMQIPGTYECYLTWTLVFEDVIDFKISRWDCPWIIWIDPKFLFRVNSVLISWAIGVLLRKLPLFVKIPVIVDKGLPLMK